MKLVVLPIALIFLFVMPFVAMKKPFNPKAVGFLGAITICLIGLCFFKGWFQLGAGLLLVFLVGLSLIFVRKR
jgi:hypothetical protein